MCEHEVKHCVTCGNLLEDDQEFYCSDECFNEHVEHEDDDSKE